MARNKMKTCKHCGAEIAKSAKVCSACGGKNKKPIFKRWWFWLIIGVLVVLVVLAFAGSSSDEKTSVTDNEFIQEEQVNVEEATVAEEQKENITEESKTDVKALKKELKKNYDLTGGSSVRNDVTDSWVIETIASAAAIDPSVWAYDYVQAYWDDSIKVMWVVNFANNTTTSINNYDGMVYVTQRDYVDKEEHDAKVLGGGTVLAEWVIYRGDDGKLVVERTDVDE